MDAERVMEEPAPRAGRGHQRDRGSRARVPNTLTPTLRGRGRSGGRDSGDCLQTNRH